jgi:hypothetical protein
MPISVFFRIGNSVSAKDRIWASPEGSYYMALTKLPRPTALASCQDCIRCVGFRLLARRGAIAPFVASGAAVEKQRKAIIDPTEGNFPKLIISVLLTIDFTNKISSDV